MMLAPLTKHKDPPPSSFQGSVETLETPTGNTNIQSGAEEAEEVTTFRPIQHLHHLFTWNNYESGDIQTLISLFNTLCEKYCFQQEIGESGTPHLQGVISLKKRARWNEFGLPKGIHWEKVIHLTKAYEYCSKEKSRVLGTFPFTKNYTIPQALKIIQNLYPYQKEIEAIHLTEPDDRTIYWFWEKTGGVGKSAFVKYMVHQHKCLFCDGGKKADLINLVFKQDMDNTRTVIWDLTRNKGNKISYDTIEAVKNGMVCNTKFETGMKLFNAPHIFIFANDPPEVENLSIDRWKIYEIKNKTLFESS